MTSRMLSTIIFLVWSALLLQVHGQLMKVCEPLDSGPYLATKPPLVFTVDEATTEDLRRAEEMGSKKYYSELRIYGDYNAGEFNLSRSLDFRFVDPFEYFSIVAEGNTTYFKLTKAIDRDGPATAPDDDISYISFTLTCTPSDPNATDVTYDAQIFINDINDNEPYFMNGDMAINKTVSEATPVGTVVFQVQAMDKDANLDMNISYALLDHTDMFSINNMTGEVKLSMKLDYESLGAQKQFVLPITAQDGGPSPIHTVTTTAYVSVSDADDQGPVFIYQDCFKHMGVCAWPKYTTGLTLKKDEPIKVLPVPNKGRGEVNIKAKDMDTVMPNAIQFKVASTIPPGHENEFRVETTKGMDDEYMANIIPLKDMEVDDGFEIFLKAEEQSTAMRHEIAMILFTGGTNGSTSGNQGGSPVPKYDDDDDSSYSNLEVALIALVVLFAAFLVCAVAALVYTCRKSRPSKNASYAMGTSNNGFSEHL